MTLAPVDYGPKVAALLADGARLADLGPGRPDTAARALLTAFDPFADLGGKLRHPDAARACLSALWLYHDCLGESHEVSQELHTADGSFLHAVMHRREPDAWNSKYWWRKVGDHPVLDALRRECPAVGYAYAGPEEFVDFCERVRGRGTPDEGTAKRVQLLEWQLIFDHCYRQAVA